MNAPVSQSKISQLNAVLERILRSWALIVDCHLELDLCFEPDVQNPARDRIAGYYISQSIWPDFGDIFMGEEGELEERTNLEVGVSTLIVTTPMQVYFPRPVMVLFQKHAATDMFEHEFDHVGISGVLEFDNLYQYTILSYLGKALREAKLDAFTETLLRPNAGSLLVDLQPYLDWLDYAASQSENILDVTRREQLIGDINLVLLYLAQGGSLPFAKLTSLCDVAGSLQPVRNLIQKDMPELAV